MLRIQPMPHLKTFARIHEAAPADAGALREIESALHLEAGATAIDWSRELAAADNRIIIARECQAAVGAAQIAHANGAAVAVLAWLGVSRSARGRGIGQLLLDTAISEARGAGAAVIRLGPIGVSAAGLHLLEANGFVERSNGAGDISIEKSLWDEKSARQMRTLEPRLYGSVTPQGAPAAAVMIAMASIDSRFLMTPQVERVIGAEIEREVGAGGDRLLRMAVSAAHRSFNVVIHDAMPHVTAGHVLGEGRIGSVTELPTPEQLIGMLSLRQVPLLEARFGRLAGSAAPDWYAVLGFDGLLFQLFEPTRPDQRDQAVTLAEMREALGTAPSRCLVVSRS